MYIFCSNSKGEAYNSSMKLFEEFVLAFRDYFGLMNDWHWVSFTLIVGDILLLLLLGLVPIIFLGERNTSKEIKSNKVPSTTSSQFRTRDLRSALRPIKTKAATTWSLF